MRRKIIVLTLFFRHWVSESSTNFTENESCFPCWGICLYFIAISSAVLKPLRTFKQRIVVDLPANELLAVSNNLTNKQKKFLVTWWRSEQPDHTLSFFDRILLLIKVLFWLRENRVLGFDQRPFQKTDHVYGGMFMTCFLCSCTCKIVPSSPFSYFPL